MGNHLGRYLEKEEHIHHIDGNKTNNIITNLELTTAREHAQKHMLEKGIQPVKERNCSNCKAPFTPKQDKRKYCSPECSTIATERTIWPSKEKLQKLVWKKPTTQIAKDLGVSDKAIEKRCKKYGIEKPPRGYWSKKTFKKTKPSKEILEKLIWEKPLIKLEKELNASENLIRKWCEEYKLKRPGPGYWRKVETRKL